MARKLLVVPMELPQRCPICDATVFLNAVTEWETESGKPISVEYECQTEPNIDSDGWEEWHNGHYSMPYVDWMPWELKMLAWLQARYYFSETPDAAPPPQEQTR